MAKPNRLGWSLAGAVLIALVASVGCSTTPPTDGTAPQVTPGPEVGDGADTVGEEGDGAAATPPVLSIGDQKGMTGSTTVGDPAFVVVTADQAVSWTADLLPAGWTLVQIDDRTTRASGTMPPGSSRAPQVVRVTAISSVSGVASEPFEARFNGRPLWRRDVAFRLTFQQNITYGYTVNVQAPDWPSGVDAPVTVIVDTSRLSSREGLQSDVVSILDGSSVLRQQTMPLVCTRENRDGHTAAADNEVFPINSARTRDAFADGEFSVSVINWGVPPNDPAFCGGDHVVHSIDVRFD
ncbi:MAG: hypothetical protein AAF356_03145 [Planctomycetota bacterium]